MYEQQHKKLASIVKVLSSKHKTKLDELKANYTDYERPDFLWHYLLQSFSTMGRVAGWHGLIGKKLNYDKVTFEAISNYDPSNRLEIIDRVCRSAKIRMPSKKAEYILRCYNRITKLGGLVAAKKQFEAIGGAEAKLRWLQHFPGIGPKYSRNIMMDVYHPDFRNYIAIDSRIKEISQHLGVSFDSYSSHEKFYLDVAKSAEIDGWELDRILFNFNHEILNRLDREE